MRNRKNRVTVRLNDVEYNHLQELVEISGLNREKVLRQLILGRKLQPKPPAEIAQLLHNLSAMGNNINQIARVANSNKSVDTELLAEIREMQSRLWKEMKGGYGAID